MDDMLNLDAGHIYDDGIGHDASGDVYPFRQLARTVLSPGAFGALEQLSTSICDIYGLTELLNTPLPVEHRADHIEKVVGRIRRVVALLPYGISPIPNEVFTAVEFLMYEIHREPIELGTAIIRLETLADEIRARPMLHDLMMNRAN